MSVTVSGGTPTGELENKRLYLKGVVLYSTCPTCKQDIKQDLGKHPLNNPPMNQHFKFTFYHGDCPGNEYGTEWSERIILKLSVEPA